MVVRTFDPVLSLSPSSHAGLAEVVVAHELCKAYPSPFVYTPVKVLVHLGICWFPSPPGLVDPAT